MSRLFTLCLLVLISLPVFAQQAPRTFREAKIQSKHQVYADQGPIGDLYCGCSWEWVGDSGGRMNLASCGYLPRKNINRAARMEWEHIVPASTFGRQRQCWQDGGRKNCTANDPVFSRMEADMHNLYPSVGEVNGDRSNYNYGIAQVSSQYGACPTRVDFKHRSVEPRNLVKGMVARVTFYMYDRYGLRLSSQQERLLMAWDRQFPVTAWELERNRRITASSGISNPFVDGRKRWTVGYRSQPMASPSLYSATKSPIAPEANALPLVIGNRNSRVYHVRGLCPSYSAVSVRNRVPFNSEAEAAEAGFRRAGNCR